MSKKKFIMGMSGILAIMFAVVLIAKANPSYFLTGSRTATATTTPAFMTPGTATSTLVYDSFALEPTYATDEAVLLTQFVGSSTSAVLNITFEYSSGYPGYDCVATPLKCDWYRDSLSELATTSPTISITNPRTYTWNYASSTPGLGAVVANNSTTSPRIIPVKVPTRYVRAVYSLGIGGTNGSVWGEIVPKREAR